MRIIKCVKHEFEAKLPSTYLEHLRLVDEVNRVILHSTKYPDCKFQVKSKEDYN